MGEDTLGLQALGNLLRAIFYAMIIVGGFLMIKIPLSVLKYLPLVGKYVDNLLTSWALTVLNTFFGDLVGPIQSIVNELDGHSAGLGGYISENTEAHITHNRKTALLHSDIEALRAQYKVPPAGVATTKTVETVRSTADKALDEARAAAQAVTNLHSYLNNHYWSRVEQRVEQAQSQAEIHSRAAIVTLIDGQDEIYRRKVLEIGSGIGLPAGILEGTIPEALALAVGAEATLLQEEVECVQPMCNDWNAAKNALEGALGALTVGGAISFLVAALTEPAVAGKLVAGEADAIGDLAIDSFYGILGLQPPGSTGLGL